MSEIFCIDCEREIKLPSGFGALLGPMEEKPVKYKTGWKCADCDRKSRNKRK